MFVGRSKKESIDLEVQRIEWNESSNDTISGDELIICLGISFLLRTGVYWSFKVTLYNIWWWTLDLPSLKLIILGDMTVVYEQLVL